MTIKLSLSYSDLQCLVSYTNYLSDKYNSIGSGNIKLAISNKAKVKAFLSEMLMLHNKLNIKLFAWPVQKRHKAIKSITISYTQAFILWINYDRSEKFILINDKIEFIAKQLTN